MAQEKSNRGQAAGLFISVSGGTVLGEDDLDRVTRGLRSELEAQNFVQDVTLGKGAGPERALPPEGAKGVALSELGSLAVVLARNAIPKLVEVLTEWTTWPGHRPIKIEVQLGDRTVKMEYAPRIVTPAEVHERVHALVATLQGPVES